MKPVTVDDYRELARRRLPRFLFEYVDGGACSEETLRRNVTDLRDVRFRQPVLRKIASLDVGTNLFGESLSMPLALAPIGMGGMYGRRGEVQAARAAAAAGVPFTLSTQALCSIEEVAKASPRPIWFQAYMMRDRGFMVDLIARAKAAGCTVLLFTVDLPVAGLRYRDYHTGLAGAPGWRGALRRLAQGMLRPGWAWDVGINGRPHRLGNVGDILGDASGLDDFFGWVARNFDPEITWKDLEFLREHWDGPIVLKGIMDVEDARTVASIGLDGLVVSNHGGRQLDGAASTVAALPGIVDAVGEELTVLIDGGVRSGTDLARMLALGARGVLVGRAWVYALAGRGQKGVGHVLSQIENELRVTMTLLGCSSIAQLDRSKLLDYPTVG